MMNFIHVFLQVALLIIIMECGYKKFTVCKFREELFSLRNQLFDLVISDTKLHYDDKAYRDMEQLINGTIRFAHSIKFVDLLLMAIYTQINYPEYMKDTKINFNKEIEKSLREIKDEETRKKLKKIRTEYQYKLLKYLYSRSFALLSFTVPFLLFIIFKELGIAILRNTFSRRTFKGEIKQEMISTFKYPIFKIENEACLQEV